jgi:hypothetical protein
MARQDREPLIIAIRQRLVGDLHFTVLSEEATDKQTVLRVRGPGGNRFQVDIVPLEGDE